MRTLAALVAGSVAGAAAAGGAGWARARALRGEVEAARRERERQQQERQEAEMALAALRLRAAAPCPECPAPPPCEASPPWAPDAGEAAAWPPPDEPVADEAVADEAVADEPVLDDLAPGVQAIVPERSEEGAAAMAEAMDPDRAIDRFAEAAALDERQHAEVRRIAEEFRAGIQETLAGYLAGAAAGAVRIRDLAESGAALLDLYLRADDSLRGVLDQGQAHLLDAGEFDLLTQVWPMALASLGGVAD